MLKFYKNQVISKYTMYQLTVEYIFLLNVYKNMDNEFKTAVDKMKADTVELINTIVDVTSKSSKTLEYQSSLPRMISSIVVSKLTGDESKNPKINRVLDSFSMT